LQLPALEQAEQTQLMQEADAQYQRYAAAPDSFSVTRGRGTVPALPDDFAITHRHLCGAQCGEFQISKAVEGSRDSRVSPAPDTDQSLYFQML
jgi:hypothetical protein